MIITGSVGTGKSSVADEIAKLTGEKHISSSYIAHKYGLVDKGEVDVEALRKVMKRYSGIKEGHLLCEKNFGENVVVVLRCHPDELRKRLIKRGYDIGKVESNVESEMLDYCLLRAEENYDKVIQLDTSGMSPKQTAHKIIEFISKGKSDDVDWSSELKQNIIEKTFIREAYKILLSHYGPQGWWPAKTRFEVIVGAILTQNTSWKNVEKAIVMLRRKKLLSAERLAKAKREEVEEAIRSSGYYKQKAERIIEAAKFFLKHKYNATREELLALNGIGPETADSIMLYAYQKPYFVIDAYTKKMLLVHGIRRKTYDEYAWLFMSALPKDVKLYNEYHALIVRLGKEWLNKQRWKTKKYPLYPLLSK